MDGDTVVDCMERVVAREGARTALQMGERTLTYAELGRRADELAQRLRRRGVARESAVALVLERSFEQIIAAYATMKAGGGFVPMDPRWPRERLRTLIQDSQPQLVVSSGVLDLDDFEDRVLDLGSDEDATLALVSEAPVHRPRGEDLAYVIYTSGSTGHPKGVEITHASLMNFLRWRWRLLEISPDDRGSHLASPAFDASIAEVWPQLTAGGCVCIAPEAVKLPATRLMDWMVDQSITLASFVPPVLAESMIRSRWPPGTRLRFMQSAGEALHAYPDPDLPFVLMNGYGPSENTVETTTCIVRATGRPTTAPPIGRAIDGVELHVLDEERRPVPQGTVGELFICGASLARGYRGRPELTAERFVRAPHLGDVRLYRTGDLVRRRPDGQLAFHGRCDDQVKVLGHRVELDETAAVLAQHPDVEAAVVLQEGAGRLAGYATARPGTRPDGQALNRFLSERLPAYMLPARIELLDALPLTPSGKVDRQSLAAGAFQPGAGAQQPPSRPWLPVGWPEAVGACVRRAGLWIQGRWGETISRRLSSGGLGGGQASLRAGIADTADG